MPNKTFDEIAAHLHSLYHAPFGDKGRGRFVIPGVSLRTLAGRSRLEATVLQKIADHLDDYGLTLLRVGTADVYGVEQTSTVQKWREVPKGVVSRESRRRRVKTVLNRAAAWPFPTGTRP